MFLHSRSVPQRIINIGAGSRIEEICMSPNKAFGYRLGNELQNGPSSPIVGTQLAIELKADSMTTIPWQL